MKAFSRGEFVSAGRRIPKGRVVEVGQIAAHLGYRAGAARWGRHEAGCPRICLATGWSTPRAGISLGAIVGSMLTQRLPIAQERRAGTAVDGSGLRQHRWAGPGRTRLVSSPGAQRL